jgi:hypothetical protein
MSLVSPDLHQLYLLSSCRVSPNTGGPKVTEWPTYESQITTCDSHEKRLPYLRCVPVLSFQPDCKSRLHPIISHLVRTAMMTDAIYASMSRSPSSSSQSTNDTEPSSHGDFDTKLSKSRSRFRRWRPSYHLQAPSGWMNVGYASKNMCSESC